MLELTYAAACRLGALGRRERQVLRLIALGQSESSVAAHLGLSAETASSLCAEVFRALGLTPTAYLDRRLLAVLTLRQADQLVQSAKDLGNSSRSRPVGGRCDASG
ncbi:hypothetical protein FHP29_15265 [Nocardioides albidus]|uniref:HTH luxR-type domain-containing protein n=1 Tax=Nocardioides albidus TaxID=1517589 RepID=A0A5C4VTN2_9ACTN|nr:LuxR C-terminal-related transcriptional regulator [Nocardioides albidus]TNM38589.1 hypothetical protein FHP29_15265 [Nocardioides albidus]